MKTPLIIGHRGAAGYALENSRASFEYAVHLGCTMVECDVQRTKDKALVVMHDDTLNRITTGRGKISARTAVELQSDRLTNDEPILFLPELLTILRGRSSLNIELKGTKTAAPTAALVTQVVKSGQWRTRQLLVSSFDHAQLKQFHKVCPAIRIGVLFPRRLPREHIAIATRLGGYSINLHEATVTAERIKQAHAAHLRVYAYTVNRRRRYQKLAGWGIDGVFSDFPDRLS